MNLRDVGGLRPAPTIEQPAFTDPDFVRASEWLARGPEQADVVLVGAPFAGGSISRARCDLTPAAVRAALARFSVWSSEHAVSVERLAVLDAGDVECPEDVEGAQEAIARVVGALDVRPVVLVGGDNSVTVGGATGVGADALITLDAHHDCRAGNSNGSPVRRLIESGAVDRVVQIGIHGFANAEVHARWALDHKVHVVLAERVRADGIDRVVEGALRMVGGARRIWVDFDIDVLDRAFAPGAPAAMPGGLLPSDLTTAAFLVGRDARVAGIDITEVDPSADVADTTVRTACSVLMHYFAGVASR